MKNKALLLATLSATLILATGCYKTKSCKKADKVACADKTVTKAKELIEQTA